MLLMVEAKKTLLMDRDKVIQECANQFMVRTSLNEISWQDKICREMRDVLEIVYGAGYDYGRDEIKFHQAREVLQMGEYGIVISSYKSVRKAAKAVEGNASNIRAVLSGRQHTAYGFQWRWADSFFDYSTTKDLQDEEDIS